MGIAGFGYRVTVGAQLAAEVAELAVGVRTAPLLAQRDTRRLAASALDTDWPISFGREVASIAGMAETGEGQKASLHAPASEASFRAPTMPLECNTVPLSSDPFGSMRYKTVGRRRMAYIDEGEGDAIVFQHGNPTSSYLWRNVMPHCASLGRRLVACDLIGMGHSDKLEGSGPESYRFAEHCDHLYGLWDALGLGDRVVLVLHDWGSALGLHWAALNPARVAGIAYMEALVGPMEWSDWNEGARGLFQGFRSPAGEALILEKNIFVERVLPSSIIRTLSDTEMATYRAPFAEAGEARRPTLTWPRQIPIEGEPAEIVSIVERYADAMSRSATPKLFLNAEPGALLIGRLREACRTWPNQEEVTVKGIHFVQEDSPDEIGEAVARFVRRVDGDGQRDSPA